MDIIKCPFGRLWKDLDINFSILLVMTATRLGENK